MITLETTLSGPQIARALGGDLEETSYCLSELANEISTDEFEEIAEHVSEPEIVGPFLRALAAAIYPTTETDDD